ncbi:DM4/DM12 family domain-containing protein [Phthorimaea operculella]|nr:DM4/DM12 family domain-containing protein [Phthorimaea operculella]
MDLDVIFPLPDKEFVRAHLRRKLHHRQKREFWERVKSALNLHNVNGHAYVLRSICEAKMFLAPPGKSLVHDLLRALFTAPLEEKEFAEEIGEHMYRDLSDPNFCDRLQECPFSLLHFILDFNRKRK